MTGRGTAALWLALQAVIRLRPVDGLPEVIMPDILCPVVAEGILLAGCVPRFAAVSTDRFTITPASVAACLTPRTAAILVAHTFGFVVDIAAVRAAAPGVPIIEDAVQGIGGMVNDNHVGTLGDLSFVSFDPTKMIAGRGGLLMGKSPEVNAMLQALQAADNAVQPDRVLAATRRLLRDPSATQYADMLLRRAADLLPMAFPESADNLSMITTVWETLPQRVSRRNQRAHWLMEELRRDAPDGWIFPAVRDGDAIWRYTFAAPSPLYASQVRHQTARHGLLCTDNYAPLSCLLGQTPTDGGLHKRLLNLWVDDTASADYLDRSVEKVRDVMRLSARGSRAGVRLACR